MPWKIVQLSPRPQMSEHRSNTICAVVERPHHHCGDDVVSRVLQMWFALHSSPLMTSQVTLHSHFIPSRILILNSNVFYRRSCDNVACVCYSLAVFWMIMSNTIFWWMPDFWNGSMGALLPVLVLAEILDVCHELSRLGEYVIELEKYVHFFTVKWNDCVWIKFILISVYVDGRGGRIENKSENNDLHIAGVVRLECHWRDTEISCVGHSQQSTQPGVKPMLTTIRLIDYPRCIFFLSFL